LEEKDLQEAFDEAIIYLPKAIRNKLVLKSNLNVQLVHHVVKRKALWIYKEANYTSLSEIRVPGVQSSSLAHQLVTLACTET
jgi:hypothetical protein